MDISWEKERNRKFIIKSFRGRCALNPVHTGSHVHEIIPKSLKIDWWVIGNQVLLCPECHDKIHSTGTKSYVDELLIILWETLLKQNDFQSLINMIAS